MWQNICPYVETKLRHLLWKHRQLLQLTLLEHLVCGLLGGDAHVPLNLGGGPPRRLEHGIGFKGSLRGFPPSVLHFHQSLHLLVVTWLAPSPTHQASQTVSKFVQTFIVGGGAPTSRLRLFGWLCLSDLRQEDRSYKLR